MAQFLPDVECLSQQENHLQLKAKIHHELLAFKGHFPEFAVFPGVAQIALVKQVVADYFSEMGTVEKMEQLRFQNFVLPEQEILISIERLEHTITFKLTNLAEQAVASGRFIFKG